jgi:Uma2 family endonuclease
MTETLQQLNTEDGIYYPESDGKPIADNTKQFDYIVYLKNSLDDWFADQPEVFIAADLLWYPVKGQPRITIAPDTLVAFGRPKGDRRSYRQWNEGNIAPQVVFEVMSESNDQAEMSRKRAFYERYGVEEFYLYDPEDGTLEGWLRQGDQLLPITGMVGWLSPRLGIRFELNGTELELYRPDGERFETYLEAQTSKRIEQQRADTERHRADTEHRRADTERQKAEVARQRAENTQRQLEELLQKLQQKGINPDEL